MNDGYIKLWRCSLDSQVWNNEGLWQMWCWCLMKATHKERWATVKTGRGETEILLLPGQFIFGRKVAAKELKAKPSTVRNRMEKLKTMRNVDIQPDTHYSIITVRNWGAFQVEEETKGQLRGQATDNQRTGNGQPKDTDKNVKNVKNVKNNKSYSPDSIEYRLSNLLFSKILLRNPDYKVPNFQTWSKHIDDLVRIDNKDPQQIANVINWVQNDSFWQNNVLSTSKLRAKFDELVLKMKPQTNTADNAREAKVAALLGGAK